MSKEVDTMKTKHVWDFFQAGGASQVSLTSGTDLAALSTLDQKLWMALSCPVNGLCFDKKTLEILDTDNDKRIRVAEILSTLEWLKKRLVSLDSLLQDSDELPLSSLNRETKEGNALFSTVREILRNAGKENANGLAPADAEKAGSVLAAARFNGDGIVPPDSAEEEETKRILSDMITCMGGVPDACGKAGIDQAHADAFFAAVSRRIEWLNRAKKDPEIFPFGKETAVAAAALKAVENKINDFFTRCALAAFDARCADALQGDGTGVLKQTDDLLTPSSPELESLPLARITPEGILPLTARVNPFWAEKISAFRNAVLTPFTGGASEELKTDVWKDIQAKLAPFFAWQAAEDGREVAALSPEQLEKLADGKAQNQINDLIQKDLAPAAERECFCDVERLLRLRKHLVPLLKNYVNMEELYDPAKSPAFRAGTLYLDARACRLCFEVTDLAAFSTLAAASKCCLVYCALRRAGSTVARTICAVVTAGFAHTLWTGRNGIFYDRDGSDWEATVVKLDIHEISLKEAFWAPWRKIAQLISTQITKVLNARQDAVLAKSAANVESASTAVNVPKKMDGAALASSVAAVGIAVGLLGSAVGGLFAAIAGIPVWKTFLGALAIFLAVSLPSVLLTALRLRARDLAPLLNAGGWAVNRKMGFSLKLGRIWTTEAVLPKNAKLSRKDPFADRHFLRTGLSILLFLALAASSVYALWRTDRLNFYLPLNWQHTTQAPRP